MTKRLSIVFMISMVAAVAIVRAQMPLLDVKMGLWEVTSVSQISGDMPKVDTSKMTAEQKAMMEQAMKSAMGSHTSTEKTCVTREKYEKGMFMMGDRQDCKQTLTSNTKTTLDATLVCTGENPMKGSMHLEAASQTAVKGKVTAATVAQGRAMNVSVTMDGKWVGANCGDTK